MSVVKISTTCLCLWVGQENQQNTQGSLQFHFGEDLKLFKKNWVIQKIASSLALRLRLLCGRYLTQLCDNFKRVVFDSRVGCRLAVWVTRPVIENVRFSNLVQLRIQRTVSQLKGKFNKHLWCSLVFFSGKVIVRQPIACPKENLILFVSSKALSEFRTLKRTWWICLNWIFSPLRKNVELIKSKICRTAVTCLFTIRKYSMAPWRSSE